MKNQVLYMVTYDVIFLVRLQGKYELITLGSARETLWIVPFVVVLASCGGHIRSSVPCYDRPCAEFRLADHESPGNDGSRHFRQTSSHSGQVRITRKPGASMAQS